MVNVIGAQDIILAEVRVDLDDLERFARVLQAVPVRGTRSGWPERSGSSGCIRSITAWF
jgi:hypothetical protein